MDNIIDLIMSNIGIILIALLFFSRLFSGKKKARERQDELSRTPMSDEYSDYPEEAYDMGYEDTPSKKEKKPWDEDEPPIDNLPIPDKWKEFVKETINPNDTRPVAQTETQPVSPTATPSVIPTVPSIPSFDNSNPSPNPNVYRDKYSPVACGGSQYNSEEGKSMMNPNLNGSIGQSMPLSAPPVAVSSYDPYEKVPIPMINRQNLRDAVIFAEIIQKPKAYNRAYKRK